MGAAIEVHRTVAWNETDAAGHNHFSAAFRWLEEAEHQMWRLIGFTPERIARIPRVHIDVDYAQRLYFGQEITVRVDIRKVGRTSCTLGLDVRAPDGSSAITGSYVIVHAASTTDGSEPWPAELVPIMESDTCWKVAPQVSQ